MREGKTRLVKGLEKCVWGSEQKKIERGASKGFFQVITEFRKGQSQTGRLAIGGKGNCGLVSSTCGFTKSRKSPGGNIARGWRERFQRSFPLTWHGEKI